MANIHGTTKAWGAIKAKLDVLQLSADRPSEIEPLLERCQLEYEQQIKQVRLKLKNEIAQLKQEVYQEEEKAKINLEAISEDGAKEIKQLEEKLEILKHDRNIFNFFRNYFRSRHVARRLADLRKNVIVEQQKIGQSVHAKEVDLDRKKSRVDELARQECREVLKQIEYLRGILGSQELANAIAEQELQDYLSQFPDNCHIINNVAITVERGVLFEGKWLINAQIDQLVITPSGLFAIEIKNWNKQPGDKGSPGNPYEPIKRAAQLCYEVIKSEFPGITVRSILAYRGRPPDNLSSGIVKALPLPEVPIYINWFKDNSLSNQAIQLLLTRLMEISKTPGQERATG